MSKWSHYPDVYSSVHKIADEGAVEFLMDRIYPTASNIRFLMEHQNERMVYWVSPLKMGLSSREVRERVQAAWEQGLWKPITYCSTREASGKKLSANCRIIPYTSELW
ncbi:MAG: hypothetical protein WA113_04615 [Desulfitobacteriaceae bacterium]